MICELMAIFCRTAAECGETRVELPYWLVSRYVWALSVLDTDGKLRVPIFASPNGNPLCQGVEVVPV